MSHRKILFITAQSLGDAVLTSGVLDRILAQRHPCRATVVCGPVPAPLFAVIPGVERVIVVRKKPLSRHWIGAWRRCCATFWDRIIDLRGTPCGYLCAGRRRHVYLASAFPERNWIHRVEELRRMLNLSRPPAPKLHADAGAAAWAKRRITGDVIAIGPFARWRGKQWPEDHFRDLCTRLRAADGLFPRARIAIFGTRADQPAAARMAGAIGQRAVIDLTGRISLPSVYACLSRCRLFIGNDSGLMHMAAAAAIPTLGLFGPSRDSRFAPWNGTWIRTPQSREELIRRYERDGRNTLMDALTVADVHRAARRVIQHGNFGAGSRQSDSPAPVPR